MARRGRSVLSVAFGTFTDHTRPAKIPLDGGALRRHDELVDGRLLQESLSGSWLSTRLGVGTQRLDAMRRAGELLGVRRPGAYEYLYPAWQFGANGKPLPVISRLVQTARAAGLSDERLYELMVSRAGISGHERLVDALRAGRDEYVLATIRPEQ